MSKGENPAQTISFYWMPFVYPVQWADSADEVPEWDVSRQPFVWMRRRKRIKPPWLSIRPPPKDSYPRLVCVEHEPEDKGFEWLFSEDDLINDLLAIYQYTPDWLAGKPVKKLRNDVLALANRYGAPYNRREHTLEAWLSLAAVVQAFVSCHRLLTQLGYEAMQGTVSEILENALEAGTVAFPDHPRTFWGSRNKKGESGNYSIYEMELLALRHIKHTGDSREWWQRTEGRIPPGLKGIRLSIADDLFSWFSLAFDSDNRYSVQHGSLSVTPTGVTADCPVSVWVFYRLSQLWRNGAEVKLCPVCGALFAPTRSNMKYCRRGTCAFKAHKQNQKARAAQGIS